MLVKILSTSINELMIEKGKNDKYYKIIVIVFYLYLISVEPFMCCHEVIWKI